MAIDSKDLNAGDKIWYIRKEKPNNKMEAIVKKIGKVSIKIQDIFYPGYGQDALDTWYYHDELEILEVLNEDTDK